MTNGEAKAVTGASNQIRERGFSVIELSVVILIILILSAGALVQIQSSLQISRADAAMVQILDQLRQAREYAITYRRYIQVTFPIVPVGTTTDYRIDTTQRNDLTPGAGAINPILSSVPIQHPMEYVVMPGLPDTPDGFGNAGAIEFENAVGGPVGGMLFDSTGALVDGRSFLPMNGGSVFLGVPGLPDTTRAVTVLGSTGRVRGWKASGGSWIQF